MSAVEKASDDMNSNTDESILTIYRGEGVEEFQYTCSEMIYGPDDFCIYDDFLYLLDTVGNRILKYSLEGEYFETIMLSEENVFSQHIDVNDRGIILRNNPDYEYLLDYSGRIVDTIEHCIENDEEDIDDFDVNSVKNPDYSYIVVSVIYNEYGDKVYLTTEYIEKPQLLTELRVNWSTDGNLECSKIIDMDGWYYYPACTAKYYEDSIYYIKCLDDRIELHRVNNDGQIDISNPCKMVTSVIDYDIYDISAVESTVYSNVSVTRSAAYNTANSYKNLNWILYETNRTGGANITIPVWIANTTNLPKNVTGMPYCWGGCMSVSDYVSKINQGYQAGNVNMMTIGYVANTAGVDCSGYASMVYNLGSHYTTAGFKNAGFQQINWNQLCKMDFALMRKDMTNSSNIAGKGNHIMLCHTRTHDTTYAFYESNSTAGKVRWYEYSQNQLNNSGYVLFRAFSTGHEEGTTWSYNSQYHYHTCVHGCNNSGGFTHYDHSFIYSGSAKTCRVCGYTTSD